MHDDLMIERCLTEPLSERIAHIKRVFASEAARQERRGVHIEFTNADMDRVLLAWETNAHKGVLAITGAMERAIIWIVQEAKRAARDA